MSKVTVLGGGGWAIALAKVLNENGHNVTLWSALEREVEALTKERENKVGLPGVKIPEKIKITNDIKEAVKDSKMIVMAVASSFVRSTSELLKDIVPDGQIIVDVAKGIEDGTFYTMTEVIEDVIPTVNAVVLSGPSHAEEVGLQVPTAVVVGAKTFETASFVQTIQKRQGLQICCPEEIAFDKGWINNEQLLKLAQKYMKTDYGKYLKDVAEDVFGEE